MTAQFPDKLMYEGREYDLFSNPLESYFDDEHGRPEFRSPNTAMWRGYIAIWELDADCLYLVDLQGWVGGDHPTYAVNAEQVGLQAVFPWAGERVKATWFSGELRVPRGERLQYVHMGYGSVYEEELLLTFEAGKLVHREVKDNRGLIPGIEARRGEEERQFREVWPYAIAALQGRRLRWREMSTRDKVVSIVAAPVFLLILPFMVPYLIYKRGWNPKKWNLF